MTWEKDKNCVIYVDNYLGKFDNIDKLLEDFSKELLDLADIKINASPENIPYQYNEKVSLILRDKTIPTSNFFVNQVIHSVKENLDYEGLISGQKNKVLNDLDKILE